MSQKPTIFLRPDRTAALLGHASLTPMTPVVAGTYGTWTLTLDHTVKIPTGKAALRVKATPHDGQMAWSSPIYMNR